MNKEQKTLLNAILLGSLILAQSLGTAYCAGCKLPSDSLAQFFGWGCGVADVVAMIYYFANR